MSASDCYIDSTGCTVCPPIVAIPYTPARTDTSANFGWNSGANSQAVLDGDLHVVDSVNVAPMDMYIGLKNQRAYVGMPATLNYALRFYSAGASVLYEVWEGPVMRKSAAPYVLAQPFEIRRASNIVSYFINSVLVYTSAARSAGQLIVSLCLYSAGDALP